MRYVGRIITNTKIADVPDLIEVTSDESFVKEAEINIPTLIIGYKNAKKLCEEVKITEKKIKDNLYWTFSKRERRSDYISGIEDFYSNVSNFISSLCHYEYIDPITWDSNAKNEFVGVIKGNHKKIIYSTDSMYYIYSPFNRKVYGMSKVIMKYVGFEDNHFENLSMNEPTFMVFNENDFQEKKLSINNFVQPLLYYLMTF